MKAIVFARYGTADDLQLRDVAQPAPTDDEVLIKVHAVSINDWDWQILQGIPFSNRMTFGLRRPKRHILGSDVAGWRRSEGRWRDSDRGTGSSGISAAAGAVSPSMSALAKTPS